MPRLHTKDMSRNKQFAARPFTLTVTHAVCFTFYCCFKEEEDDDSKARLEAGRGYTAGQCWAPLEGRRVPSSYRSRNANAGLEFEREAVKLQINSLSLLMIFNGLSCVVFYYPIGITSRGGDAWGPSEGRCGCGRAGPRTQRGHRIGQWQYNIRPTEAGKASKSRMQLQLAL